LNREFTKTFGFGLQYSSLFCLIKAQLKILEIGNIPVPEYLLRSSKEKTPAQKQEEEDLMELERWASETA
jgi:hypothetical protein